MEVLVVLDSLGSYGWEIERTSPLRAVLALEYDTTVSLVYVSEDDWDAIEAARRDLAADEAPFAAGHLYYAMFYSAEGLLDAFEERQAADYGIDPDISSGSRN